MATYTTLVRSICENYAGYKTAQSFDKIEDIIKAAAPKIFGNFPIYDENHRLELETKILRHYYMREIGQESVGLWKYYINKTLQIIMPYYNALYESAAIEYDPLIDVDYTRNSNGNYNKNNNSESTGHDENTSSTENEGNGTSSGNNYDLTSNTPQGGLSGIDNEDYLSLITKHIIDEKTTAENKTAFTGSTDTTTYSTGTENGDDSRTEKIKGKHGSSTYSAMIKEYRETILNIDLMIIDELKYCFMLIN